MSGYRIYELRERGLSGPPIVVTATDPRKAVIEEYGAVFWIEGSIHRGDPYVLYGSKLLDADRIVYIEVREIEVYQRNRVAAPPHHTIVPGHLMQEDWDEWAEPDSLGG